MTLRVLAGTHKGRALAAPESGTALRPTAARRRAAAFDILRARLGDFAERRFADLFAGTGAVGVEALSQGFAEAVFVEHDARAARLILRNLEALSLGGCGRVLASDATRLPAAPDAFDAVFLDPPYGRDCVKPCLEALVDGGWLTAATPVLVELGREDGVEVPAALRLLREYPHGAGRLLCLVRG